MENDLGASREGSRTGEILVISVIFIDVEFD